MWETEIGTMVRYLVDDRDSSSYTFCDEQIEETILVAAKLILTEVDFDNTYSINIEGGTISPDPTSVSDNSFMNLSALKAACILMHGLTKQQSLNAIKVNDGPSTIDMTNSGKQMMALYQDLCNRFDKAKFEFKMNGVVGDAILSPYSPGSDYVYHSNRRFPL